MELAKDKVTIRWDERSSLSSIRFSVMSVDSGDVGVSMLMASGVFLANVYLPQTLTSGESPLLRTTIYVAPFSLLNSGLSQVES